VTSLEVVNEAGQVVMVLDGQGITLVAPGGRTAVFKLQQGTDAASVKLVTQQMPLGIAAVTVVDNIV
jgi:hypothetical protein